MDDLFLLVSRQVGLLASGDLLCLLVFSVVGRFSHGLPVLDFETWRTADPFVAGRLNSFYLLSSCVCVCVCAFCFLLGLMCILVGWILSAYFLGAYGDDGRGMSGFNKAVLAATKSWAIGIPVSINPEIFI